METIEVERKCSDCRHNNTTVCQQCLRASTWPNPEHHPFWEPQAIADITTDQMSLAPKEEQDDVQDLNPNYDAHGQCGSCFHEHKNFGAPPCIDCVDVWRGGECVGSNWEPNATQPVPEETTDVINRPSHYTQGRIEVIDFIEDQKLDFRAGSAIKYVCRHKYKNGLEDLKKARWFINRLIEKWDEPEDTCNGGPGQSAGCEGTACK